MDAWMDGWIAGSMDRWIDDCEDMQAGIKVCNHCVCGMDGWISTNSSPSLRMDTYALGSPFTPRPPSHQMPLQGRQLYPFRLRLSLIMCA